MTKSSTGLSGAARGFTAFVLPSHRAETLRKAEGHNPKAKVVRNESKTSKLWLQYLDMVDLIFELYRGERTGDFKR